MNKPSFFIVGAPKCGTTALCKYLNRHPEIFIPKEKELHFFDKDMKTKSLASDISTYHNLFLAAQETQICGEGSPTYLYSEVAAQEIYQYNPDAKIIIMLREPVSMMYSFHSQHLFNGSSEDVQSFKKALDLEVERKQGRSIPLRCKEPKMLFYRDFATFSVQVKRYLEVFSKHQIKFIIFDDFKRDTRAIFRDALNFLEVNVDFEMDFKAKNSNKKRRSQFLRNLVKQPPAKLLGIGKYLIPLPQSIRRRLLESLKKKINSLNTKTQARDPLEFDFEQQLKHEFEGDIKCLEKLINRDLSHWYSSPQ